MLSIAIITKSRLQTSTGNSVLPKKNPAPDLFPLPLSSKTISHLHHFPWVHCLSYHLLLSLLYGQLQSFFIEKWKAPSDTCFLLQSPGFNLYQSLWASCLNLTAVTSQLYQGFFSINYTSRCTFNLSSLLLFSLQHLKFKLLFLKLYKTNYCYGLLSLHPFVAIYPPYSIKTALGSSDTSSCKI